MATENTEMPIVYLGKRETQPTSTRYLFENSFGVCNGFERDGVTYRRTGTPVSRLELQNERVTRRDKN